MSVGGFLGFGLLGAEAGGAGAAGGGGGLSPANLVGLKGWWDASVFASMTIGTGIISQINDQSGVGQNLTSAAGPTYNATGLNSRPTMTFDGTKSLANAAFAFGSQNTMTAFFVGIMSAGAGSFARAISYKAGGTGDNDNFLSYLIARNSSSNQMTLYRNGNQATGNITLATPFRCIIVVEPTLGQELIYINGALTSGVSVNSLFGASGTLALGIQAGTAAAGWIGQISEAGLATGFTNATDVASLDTYLKNKWGL